LADDPSRLGLACFIMGAVTLGLSLAGVVPARALGALCMPRISSAALSCKVAFSLVRP
jgi:hypothetical protein